MKEQEFVTEEGYLGVIKFVNNSHYCGYVCIPNNHSMADKSYDDQDVQELHVHGGIIYADVCFINPKEYYAYGFDCTQQDDLAISKDFNYAKTEVESLSKQLKDKE